MLVTEMIERGARRFADLPAVLFGDAAMTFAEVNALANRMAHVLIDHDAGHGRRVRV